MAKIRKTDEMAMDPDELCREAFSRCSNWPQDRAGQLGLAQGLKRAADRHRINQAALVRRCAELSAFCPTDHDLMRVAEEMAEDKARAPMGCEVCRGSGWRSFQKQIEPIPGQPYMADYATFCTCERGQWMKAADDRRKAEARAKAEKRAS